MHLPPSIKTPLPSGIQSTRMHKVKRMISYTSTKMVNIAQTQPKVAM